jgi:hypothetical protein|tara:strand:- start:862 stop:1134 length:273 start_codon:yes stop_codon:yes gene_type:complete
MGQFLNQPDFGTLAEAISTTDTITSTTSVNGSCLYIGTAGDVNVILTGVVGPSLAKAVLFKGVAAGSFLPVIVDYVLATNTTASDIVAIK